MVFSFGVVSVWVYYACVYVGNVCWCLGLGFAMGL